MLYTCVLCTLLYALFFTIKNEVKILIEELGEENNAAVDWKVRGELSDGELFDPSLSNQRDQPCPEPFWQRMMGTLHLMNATLVAVCSWPGGTGGTRGREAARGRCCGNCRAQAEVGLALGVTLVVRC